ncbi:tannase/feruloyl esterase family alpha/beta hydrolase [Massilia luteola]|uniref:tannase/feruloyl esterase family alpha/beta hydrolase n=1 Tax=Massilia luteola TaxID=3081751 RepID=UPI003CC5F0CD
MQKQMGASAVDEFARLYLVPGVGHCAGGEGDDNIDLVTKITGWVEQGTTARTTSAQHRATTCVRRRGPARSSTCRMRRRCRVCRRRNL